MQKYSALMGYSADYDQKLRRFNTWQVIYVPHQLSAGDAADCQVNDLQLRRDLEDFKLIDFPIAAAVLKTFERHMDFLAPEYSFLSLISKKVSLAEKRQIASALASVEENRNLQPAQLKPAVVITHKTELHELAQGDRVFLLFQSINIDRSFLAKDPSVWGEEVGFQRLSKFVKNVKVVNDVAEHAIQMATDYNQKITKDETQRQYLYATISQQRRERNDLRRQSLQPHAPANGTEPSKDRSEFQRKAKS